MEGTLNSWLSSICGKFRSAVSEKKSKMSQLIRGRDGHLVFPIGPKTHNLVGDVEFLTPVKFRQIPFNGLKVEVEYVSVYPRPRWPSCFSDRPEKPNLVEDVEFLLSVKFGQILFSGFRGEVENMKN